MKNIIMSLKILKKLVKQTMDEISWVIEFGTVLPGLGFMCVFAMFLVSFVCFR